MGIKSNSTHGDNVQSNTLNLASGSIVLGANEELVIYENPKIDNLYAGTTFQPKINQEIFIAKIRQKMLELVPQNIPIQTQDLPMTLI